MLQKMITKEEIDRFYKDVAALGLKFPGSTISEATGFSKSNVSEYLSRKKEPSENFLKAFYAKFSKGSRKDIPTPIVQEDAAPYGQNAGYVPADKLIQALEVQNEFLRRNFETSLKVLVEGQRQAEEQVSVMTYYSILALNGGDREKALAVIGELNNGSIASGGVNVGAGKSQTEGKTHTSGKQK